MATKKTMKELILEHLQKNGSITSWEAIQNYHCTRISQYIYLLRNEDYNIKSEYKKVKTLYGDITTIAVYKLIKN